MNPWKGVNANIMLMEGLKKAGYGDKAIDFVVDCFKDKFKFEGFSDKDLSDFSGPVTINLGKVEADSNGTVLSVDLRLPVGIKKEEILKILSEKAAKYNMTVEEFDWLASIHLPLESPFIQHLLPSLASSC